MSHYSALRLCEFMVCWVGVRMGHKILQSLRERDTSACLKMDDFKAYTKELVKVGVRVCLALIWCWLFTRVVPVMLLLLLLTFSQWQNMEKLIRTKKQ